MQKMLLASNERQAMSAIKVIENVALLLVQELVSSFNALDIGTIGVEDLPTLIGSPIELIYDKMTGTKNEVDGLSIDKIKMIDLLQKPAGYSAFIDKHAELTKQLRETNLPPSNRPITELNIDRFFELRDDSSVCFKEEMKDEIYDLVKEHITSDKGLAVYRFANDVVESYTKNGIGQFYNSSGDGVIGLLKKILVHPFGQTISVNTEGIKREDR